MNFLIIHQNFPAQFRHVVKALLADPAHRVVGLADGANMRPQQHRHPRLTLCGYKSPPAANGQTHPYVRSVEQQVRRGQRVVRAARALRQKGFVPDVVLVHAGWGEGLFIREVFPEARHIHYCEFYYRAEGADTGFDPEFPAISLLDSRLKLRISNSTSLVSLVECDAAISPTAWQRSLYPVEFHEKIQVMHEGVDTDGLRPVETAELVTDAGTFRVGDELVTFVARNLEPYRGFHRFMRALPEILARRPRAHVLIVGGDGVSYGSEPQGGSTFREQLVAELGTELDWQRVHFLGRLPYAKYVTLLQVSSVHVYLTYPFVLSWSMLEAMAVGCVVVGSATAPVQEVVRHGENGLLVDFFDTAALADTVVRVLENPAAYLAIRHQARASVQANYDLGTVCLPQWLGCLGVAPP